MKLLYFCSAIPRNPSDYGIVAPLKGKVSLIIDKVIDISGPGGVDICKILKIEALGKHFRLRGSCLVPGVQFFEDAVIFPKPVVDIPHQVS